MGRGREQRREEREVLGRRGTATRYRLRPKRVAVADACDVQIEPGQFDSVIPAVTVGIDMTAHG